MRPWFALRLGTTPHNLTADRAAPPGWCNASVAPHRARPPSWQFMDVEGRLLIASKSRPPPGPTVPFHVKQDRRRKRTVAFLPYTGLQTNRSSSGERTVTTTKRPHP